MKLEDQVCSVEMGKRLVELGVTGPSVFSWRFDAGMKWRVDPEGYFDPHEEHVECFPAFTVAELGVMLPSEWGCDWNKKFWPKRRGALDWIAGDEAPLCIETFTEAEARAGLLIQMLLDGDVTVSEVNARLSA